MTFDQYRQFSRNVHERAQRLERAMIERARETCAAAGLSPDLLGIHPHNAMVSYRAGQPWPEVDYQLCRKTLWQIEQSYIPMRLASKIVERAWQNTERVCGR